MATGCCTSEATCAHSALPHVGTSGHLVRLCTSDFVNMQCCLLAFSINHQAEGQSSLSQIHVFTGTPLTNSDQCCAQGYLSHVASLVRHPVPISDWRSVPTELHSSPLETDLILSGIVVDWASSAQRREYGGFWAGDLG